MIVFISGGSGCGKSAFAESVAQKLGGELVYVATMPIYGEEDLKKVERHHKLRAGKGFRTLERPKLLSELPDNGETVLIECMSTHTANFMYDPDIAAEINPKEKEAVTDVSLYTDKLKEELLPILKRSGNTVFVSAEVGFDGTAYDPETEKYRMVLSNINRFLMEQSDAGYEVVCGIPLTIKGEETC